MVYSWSFRFGVYVLRVAKIDRMYQHTQPAAYTHAYNFQYIEFYEQRCNLLQTTVTRELTLTIEIYQHSIRRYIAGHA